MTNQYVGGGPSRVSLIVVVLLVIALMAALLAAALAMGIIEFRGLGGGQAVVSPTPGQVATPAPTESPEPSPEPSPDAPTAAPATPEPLPGEATAQPSPGGVHIVQAGESLFSIGQLYGVPWGEIAAANEMDNPDLLSVGQELIIPVPGSASPPPGIHVVRTGESISSIAELYDVTPTDLAEANGIENWDLIFVGQELRIPGRAPALSPSPEP